MISVRTAVATVACSLTFAGCGSAAVSPSAAAAPAVRHATSGTISWSKGKIHLQYPPIGPKRVVLNFWGPDGYFTEPMYCRNDSKIKISHGQIRGNPSGDEYVVYSFRAKSAGPDACDFDAVLGSTGSPPIAVLKIAIGN